MKGVNIESLHVEPTNSEGTEGQMVFRVNTDASPELLQELSSIDGVISAE